MFCWNGHKDFYYDYFEYHTNEFEVKVKKELKQEVVFIHKFT